MPEKDLIIIYFWQQCDLTSKIKWDKVLKVN